MNPFTKVTLGGFILITYFLGACQPYTDPTFIPTRENLNDPLPPFLSFVNPKPQEVITLAAYQEGKHYLPHSPTHPSLGKNSICAEIVPEPLLEPGDFFAARPNQGEYLPHHISAYLNDTELKWSGETITILGNFYLRDKNGKVIAEAPGPYIICWSSEVEPGTHTATIEAQKTSGETLVYSWTFKIIDS